MSEKAEGLLLDVHDLVAGYRDDIDILRGISFRVQSGELVAVIGPNGAGKSTLIKCLCGLIRIKAGTIDLRGEQIAGLRPYAIVRRGIGYVPQRDNVFPRMTVEENLEIGAMSLPKVAVTAAKERMLDLFPVLEFRRKKPAGVLSGGERQMLAIARALMPEPQVLLLDEPSAGVDPRTVAALWERIRAVHEHGVTTVLVEQNARQALAISDRGYVLDSGEVSFEGTSRDLLGDPRVAELYLGG